MDEGEVVLGLLLPADEQAAEAVEPAVCDLHHPAPRRDGDRGGPGGGSGPACAGLGRACAACSRARWRPRGTRRSRSPGPSRGAARCSPPPAALRAAARPAGRPASSCRGGWRRRAPWRGGCRARRSAGGAARRPPASGYPAVSGVAPGRFGLAAAPCLPSGACTLQPSAASHAHCRPSAPSYAASRRAHARSRQPYSTHSCSRSWAVDLGPNAARGQAAHCAPVRASQISPSRIGRSSLRLRPGFFRGLSTTKQRLQLRPQGVIHAPDRRVVAGRLGCRESGLLRFHASTLPQHRTFRIGC